MGQFDWNWMVQGEGELRAACPTVGLRPPGGSGRTYRMSGHLVLTAEKIMTRKRRKRIKKEEKLKC